MTGRFPGAFNDKDGKQARENSGASSIVDICDEVKNTTIAAFLKKAGYDLVYGGKEHLPKGLTPKALGFNDICDDQREKLAKETAKYIKGEHDKPYFMVVSPINPHDICYMAIRYAAGTGSDFEKKLAKRKGPHQVALDNALKMPDGVSEEEFFEKYCPPLPANIEPQKDEPKAISSLINRRNFRRLARENFTDKQWRRHRWAYCRLTELVDSEIQIILDAIKQSGAKEDTLVIFSSDHGDNDSSHRLEHKTTFYEESANIPFMAMWKGQIPAGKIDDKHLVSNGLDLLPTVCDYAGIKGVSDPRGKSLRPLFEGSNVKWRNTLGVENEIGRMVVSKDKLKYIRYDAEGKEERLLDLKKDPHETTYFTDDPKYASKLDQLRKTFDSQWFPGC
jgi:choline-sulfatase